MIKTWLVEIAKLESVTIKDTSGNVRCMNSYNLDSFLWWHREFTYDAQGCQVSVVA